MQTLFKYLLLGLFMLLYINAKSQWNLITQEDNKFDYSAVYFANDSTGYVVGSWVDTSLNIGSGVILRTLNYGNTWDTTFVPLQGNLYSIYFTSQNIGFVCGDGGMIFKTTDAGDNWFISRPGPGEAFKSIFFIDELKGFACNSDGTLMFYKTIDGGVNWIEDTVIASGRSIYFPSPNVGYVSDGAGGHKTINGGNSWSYFYTNTINRTFFPLHFLNDSVGYMGGLGWGGSPNYGFATITKTTDGGNTWVTKDFQNMSMINDIFMINENVGYAVGQGNATDLKFVLKTIDGVKWYPQQLNYGSNYAYLNGVYCTNDSTCYAVGWYGAIYKTTNGGGSLIGSNINELSSTSDKIILFPNPASDILTLTFETEKTETYMVDIIDISGRILISKQSDKLTKGRDNFNLDVSSLTQGMYLLKVVLDGKVYSNKFIIK
ncbi:MAG: T9SS type A sorting domain-containing protein [Bacteroidia bacterium]|nr:T9SS type A sorting domain-containing protein [Bacteroidia bacterium]